MKKAAGTKLGFRMTDGQAKAYKNDVISMDISCQNGLVTWKIYYDFRDTPLVLEAAAAENDVISLVMLPYRLELRVNDAVQDEEWPAGNCLYTPGDVFTGSMQIYACEYTYIPEELPVITGTFSCAEGWRPGEKIYAGDCMPYTDGGRYHVLYLKDRRHHRSKWGLGAHQWEHISTDDFSTWQMHPMAVGITDPREGSICTGSWIKRGSDHYLFYTVRMADGSAARICRSISHDGYHFVKDDDFSFVLSDRYHGPSARDPKLVLDKDGLYHMFLTTTLLSENRGCLAHLVSDDLDTWREADEPIYISPDEDQPECPDYIEYGGYYYLIFSHHGYAQYLYSKKPFSDWQKPAEPAIPCEAVPKGAIWGDKIVFTGFNRMNGYAGTLTFRSAHNIENGELIFE